MKYSDEVERLAETLKNSGLSASMEDALEKAQSMIGKVEVKEEAASEEVQPAQDPVDVSQTTLGGEDVPSVEEAINESNDSDELKKEEVFTDKATTEGKQERPNNQKKIDLAEVFNVNK